MEKTDTPSRQRLVCSKCHSIMIFKNLDGDANCICGNVVYPFTPFVMNEAETEREETRNTVEKR